MNLKMICIDLDGTLFNGKNINRISKDDRKAVYNAYKSGVQVVITTGRLFNNAAAVSRSLKLKCPVISSNGSIVCDENLNTLLYENISLEDCLKVSKLIKKYGLIAHFYTKDRILPNNFKAFIIGIIYKYMNFNLKFKINIDYIFNNKKLIRGINKYKEEIVKCVVYSLNDSAINKFKQELKSNVDLTVCGDGKYSAEVTSGNASKGEAVKFLGEYLNISRSEILSIGDNENDVSMMKNSGSFVAMNNAVEILRKSADYVTDTNRNSGVSKAINKFLH